MRCLSFLLLLCLMLPAVAVAADARFVSHRVTLDGTDYGYQVFVPVQWTAARRWPVVLFLHGSGEAGRDNQRQMTQGLPRWLRDHPSFPAVVVIPQAPEHTYWNGATEAMAMRALEDSIVRYHGNRHRLCLTGLSMGGYGVWQFAVDHPGVFAAAATMSGAISAISDEPALHVEGIPGGVDPYSWVTRHDGRLPVWLFHGSADTVVPPGDDRRLATALKQAHDEVRYTEFPGVNHGSWVPGYDTPALWPWMFSHQLPGPPPR